VRPFLLGSAVLAVYALTLSCAYSGDDMQWIMQVESAVTGAPMLHPASLSPPQSPGVAASVWDAQPRYLLAIPASAALFGAARSAGWSTSALVPVQLAHALLGTLGVLWCYLALRRVVDERYAALASLGLAASYAWWFYSTHPDYPMAAHALSCLFLFVAVRLIDSRSARWRWWHACALGGVSALATLFLITRVILIPVAIVALRAAPNNDMAPLPRLRRDATAYLAGLVGVLALVLASGAGLCVVAADRCPSSSALWTRATYAGSIAHRVELLDIPKVLYGLAKSLVVYPPAGRVEPTQLLATSGKLMRFGLAAWNGLLVLLAALPFASLAQFRPASPRSRALLVTLVAWFAVELPFAVYWEPTYAKWLIGMLIPWWSLVGLAAYSAAVRRAPVGRHAAAGVGAFVALVFAVNGVASFLPRATCAGNPWLRATERLTALSTSADLFVSLAARPIDFYLPYFGRRHVVSLDLLAGNGDPSMSRFVRPLAETTLRQGGQLYVYPCDAAALVRAEAVELPLAAALQPIPLDGGDGLSVCRAGAAR